MTSAPPELLTPEEEELARKRACLAALVAQLADRELELAALQADLDHFERRYLQTVGRRYALLDRLRADIAEARARRDPHNQEARDRARSARSRARESARAVGEEQAEAVPPGTPGSAPRPQRPDSLDRLYRQAARLLHPDLTLDGDEKQRRHRLMADLNDAYARGDEDGIRAILRDWHASPESVQGDSPGAELVRVIRKIAQVEKRLQAIAAELDWLREGELFKLKRQVEEAHANGLDLLKDLGEQLDWDIAQAREELNRTNAKARA
jgi:hypothetical protein